LLGIIINTYFENRELQIGILHSLKFYYKAFFASILMLSVGFTFQLMFFENTYSLFSLCCLLVITIVTYGGLIWIFSKEEVVYLKNAFFR